MPVIPRCSAVLPRCMHVLTTLFTLMPELSSVLKCMKLCRSRDMKKRQARPRLHQHIICQQNTYFTLHTVGPIIQWEVTREDEELLASCYKECLKLADQNGVTSIVFCCLSTGVFRFPQQRAAEIATNTVKQYLDKDSRIKKVIFNVFKDEDLKIYNGLL